MAEINTCIFFFLCFFGQRLREWKGATEAALIIGIIGSLTFALVASPLACWGPLRLHYIMLTRGNLWMVGENLLLCGIGLMDWQTKNVHILVN